MLYGAETLTTTESQYKRMDVAEMKILDGCVVSLKLTEQTEKIIAVTNKIPGEKTVVV